MRTAPRGQTRFTVPTRVLHWLMAAMILTQLFIGATMIGSLSHYHGLMAVHRPLGVAILLIAAIRLLNRQLTTAPPWPPTMSPAEQRIASWSERWLYVLFFALPLVGWGALSAGHLPTTLVGSVHLPRILPARPHLFGILRSTHAILAWLLFLTVMAHVSAILFHTLILRDGMLDRMALWGRARAPGPGVEPPAEQRLPPPRVPTDQHAE